MRSIARVRVGALSLVAAAPVLFAADLVRSDHSGSAAHQFTEVAASRTPELVSAALFLLAALLLAVAGFGLAGSVEGRGGRLANVGSALLCVGALWIGAGRAMYASLLYAVTTPNLRSADAVAVFDKVSSSAAVAIFLPTLLALIVGPFVFGLGLKRAGLVPVYVPVAWLLAAIAFQAVEGRRLAEAATFGPMMLALAALGLAVARRSSGTRLPIGRVAAIATLALVGVLALAAGAAATPRHTLVLIGKTRSETSLMRGTKQPQPGSRFLEYGTLSGAATGTFAIEGVLASPASAGVELTTATLMLSDGTLVAVGSHRSVERFTMPILGGTGLYAGKQGTISFAPLPKGAERLTIKLP